MNMQNVNGTVILNAKNRMAVLQETIRKNHENIQAKHDARFAKMEASKRNRATPTEYIALYPSAPSTTAEAALLASKQALLNAATFEPTKRRLNQEMRELESIIARKGSDYLAEKLKPSRPMTSAEFLTLNPALVDANFTSELAAIAAAKTEANLLGSFMRSVNYPVPGNYDVDFLVGTTVSYP